MSDSKKLRFAIIGLGGMGRNHAASLRSELTPSAELTAVCDQFADLDTLFPELHRFRSIEDLLSSGTADALLIATPHYSHMPLGVKALEAGWHVLVEKPICVHKADCERFFAAKRHPGQIFAAMFQMRTAALYQKIRQLIQSGELGELRRVNWIITDWFRSESYYKSAGWRATWGGEGGGVLINQCPHQLDLWQWLFGMPKRIQTICQFGRYHSIGVEDDVTAMMEYDNGMTGVFITSTGEAPGTNRLEIAGERGRLVIEKGQIHFTRNEVPMSEFSRTTKASMVRPPVWDITIPVEETRNQHARLIQNVAEAALHGAPLIAPAEEGIYSVELANAMLLSGFRSAPVDLPIAAAEYEAELRKRIDQEQEHQSK